MQALRKFQFDIEDDAYRIFAHPVPHIQSGVIMQSRIFPNQDSVFLRPPSVYKLPTLSAADPFGRKIIPRHKAILGLRPFKNDIGPLLFDLSEKTAILTTCFLFEDARLDLDPGISEDLDSFSSHQRI